MCLQGKTALVTGSTSGIGQAIAEAFARAGASVVVSGRDEQRGKAVVETICTTGGSATFVCADLSSKTEVDRLAREATEAFGQIDILVNNAGISSLGPTAHIDEATFDALLNINVKAPYYLTATLAPQMAERGAGKIINITTMAAHVGMPGLALYGATKAALTLLTYSCECRFRRGSTPSINQYLASRPSSLALGDCCRCCLPGQLRSQFCAWGHPSR